MKTKTKVFLIPVIVLAFVACMMLGLVMINNTPTTVSAEGETNNVTLHFYNTWNWGSVNYYAFGASGNNGWPGKEMTSEGGNWYSITIDRNAVAYTTVVFNGGSDQTVDIDISGLAKDSNTYYAYSGNYDASGHWFVNTSSTTTKTLYFYNSEDWGSVTCHHWTYDGDKIAGYHTDWPGVAMTSAGGKWYSIDVPLYRNRVIFNNNGGGTQTIDIDWSNYSNEYFMKSGADWSGHWTVKTYSYAIEEGYYVVGDFTTPVWQALAAYKMSEDNDDYTAYFNSLSLTKGTELEVEQIVAGSGDNYYSPVATDGVNTIKYAPGDPSDGNGVITYDGTYNVFLTKGGSVSFTRANAEALDVLTPMYKISSSTDGEGNHYILFAVAFNVNACAANGSYSVGFSINGTEYDLGGTYYEGVYLHGAGGYKGYYAQQIYGSDSYTGYGIIIIETTCTAGSAFTVQGYVKNGGVVVATSATKTNTVTSEMIAAAAVAA